MKRPSATTDGMLERDRRRNGMAPLGAHVVGLSMLGGAGVSTRVGVKRAMPAKAACRGELTASPTMADAISSTHCRGSARVAWCVDA